MNDYQESMLYGVFAILLISWGLYSKDYSFGFAALVFFINLWGLSIFLMLAQIKDILKKKKRKKK